MFDGYRKILVFVGVADKTWTLKLYILDKFVKLKNSYSKNRKKVTLKFGKR